MVNALQNSAFLNLQKTELYKQVRQTLDCYSIT